MQSVITLIDKAIALCGSASELARRLDVPRQVLHQWKTGERPMSPETVALIGDLLELPGAEVRELAAWAVIDNVKNAGKREKLKRAFFGALVTGAVGITLQVGPTDATAMNSQNQSTHPARLSLYIMSNVRLLWRAACRRLRAARSRRLTVAACSCRSGSLGLAAQA